MAYINFKTSEYHKCSAWTGNSAVNTIVNNVDTDQVWIKRTDAGGNNQIFDKVRGVYKYLVSNGTHLENNSYTNNLTAFNSNGFTLGADSSDDINDSGGRFVSRAWKMGTTSGLSGGTITPSSYSFSTVSKQGIYKYSGNGSAGATIPHGLGAVPSCIIIKKLNATSSWMVYHQAEGPTKVGYLNDTVAFGSGTNVWNSVTPTTSLITLGADGDCNASGSTYIMYVYCNVKGYFRAGTYTGNGNANGGKIFTGFRPSFFFLKGRAISSGWFGFTDTDLGYNTANKANGVNYADASGSANANIFSNGFKIITTNGSYNTSEAKYLYMAWGSQPIVGSDGTVGVAN